MENISDEFPSLIKSIPSRLEKLDQLTHLDNLDIDHWDQDRATLVFSNHLDRLIIKNLYFNLCLWKLEDKARDPKASDKTIAEVKRGIDRFNQARNDQIEIINEDLINSRYSDIDPTLPWVTETPGSVFDRINIMNLKVHFLTKQIQSTESNQKQASMIQQKLDTAKLQIEDLTTALSFLDHRIKQREVGFKIYRQLKLYNDKKHNPYLKN